MTSIIVCGPILIFLCASLRCGQGHRLYISYCEFIQPHNIHRSHRHSGDRSGHAFFVRWLVQD